MLYILYERDEGKGCAKNGLPSPSLYTHHVGVMVLETPVPKKYFDDPHSLSDQYFLFIL